MTKKDYKRIGLAIAEFYKASALNEVSLNILIDCFAYQLREDNWRFDEEKFKNYILKLIEEAEK